MYFKGDFNYFFNGESKTSEEIKHLVDENTTVSIDGLSVNYSSPKEKYSSWKKEFNALTEECLKFPHPDPENTKQFLKSCTIPELKQYLTKFKDGKFLQFEESVDNVLPLNLQRSIIEQLCDLSNSLLSEVTKADGTKELLKDYDKIQEFLKEADEYQEQNGGILKGMDFPFDNIVAYWSSKEQKVIEDWNRKELYIIPPSKENLDRMSDSFMDRVKNDSDKCGIVGKKESKTEEKAPVFTYCKQMKNAVEALSLRSLYGHNKYEKGNDWENFSRVENGEFEYANAAFRHALGIGEEDERSHLIAEAWNSVAKLELFLRKNNK